MYNEHIFCEEYDELKQLIEDISNGDSDMDINEVRDKIQEIYDDGKMPSSQYDELMGYIQDLE